MNKPKRKLVPTIPAPAWLGERMEASRNEPPPTLDEVRQQLKASAEYRRIEGFVGWLIEQRQLHLAGVRPAVSKADIHEQARLGAERIRRWEEQKSARGETGRLKKPKTP